jgi:hypothetical protein
MQEAPDPITIRATIPGESTQVEWTLCELVTRLQGELGPSLTATDAPANLQITGELNANGAMFLGVKVLEQGCAGSVPLANQKVIFQVYRGVSGTGFVGTADPSYLEAVTHADGTASATLKPGATTGAVTILATFEDAPPVQFDLNIVAGP